VSVEFRVVINAYDFNPAFTEVDRGEKVFRALFVDVCNEPLRSGVSLVSGLSLAGS
jgi:hypothetical protein